jgi:hypothetical protein
MDWRPKSMTFTMNDSLWDQKLKAFLKKTGDDFKRFGQDVKAEAQKLMTEVQDPARQQKLREGLKDVGHWAKKAAEEAATLMENGVKKAEQTLVKAQDKVNDFVATPVAGPSKETPSAAAAPTPPSPPPQMEPAAEPTPERTVKKTMGKGGMKKKANSKKTPAKKTIGK